MQFFALWLNVLPKHSRLFQKGCYSDFWYQRREIQMGRRKAAFFRVMAPFLPVQQPKIFLPQDICTFYFF